MATATRSPLAARVERSLRVGAADVLVDHYHPRGDDLGVVAWIRTPYGRKGIASIALRFARAGAHVLVEEVRGDSMTFAPEDAAAVLAWLRIQPWFPGAIVTWGHSAIGYASWALAGMEIPEWRLAILQDVESELADAIIYPGGAFAGAVTLSYVHSVEWLSRHPRASLPRSLLASVRGARRARRVLAQLPLGTPDQRLVGHRVDYFQDWLVHQRDEEYWRRLNLRRNAAGMPGLVHLASGWYDVCLSSVLADHRALRDAGKRVRLVIGPWYHGRGVMDRAYGADVDGWLRAAAHGTDAPGGAPVRVHVGGAGEWRDLPDWPPPGCSTTAWHLHPKGRLATTPAPSGSLPDRYTYDPAHPTPSVGGAVEPLDGTAGAKDNRRLERRADVLTYTSDTLDADLEVIGPVTATITLRATLDHVDVFVRLCDVHPDGRSVNLCDGIRRLVPIDPPPDASGTRTAAVDLTGVAHRFHAGHRLRVQVSSGAHPRFVRNTGTGEPLATATALRAADVEIFHASRIALPHTRSMGTVSPAGR
jgi:putative CocE/NonD family hydrolase